MAKKASSNYYTEWLEKSIAHGHINYYEYSEFKNIHPIGRGSYGNVNRANWKNVDHFFALKSFSNDKQTLEEIIKELKLHRNVDVHENIIRLCGITIYKGEIQNYSLVLEYADSGTLNTYLSKHFNELNWNDKSRLASQLASAVEFLHDNDIIHRDLHGNNVLIHQKNVKLTDFGLSKRIVEASSNTSKLLGVIPYMDPMKFNNQNYKLNKKSDVYSVGILLWQISSGRKPFHKVDYDLSLTLSILKGKREEIIGETPVEYSNLYRECWKYEPDERPNIQEVVLALKTTISPEIVIYDFSNDEKNAFSSEEYKPNSDSSKVTMEINNDLNINNSLKLNTMSDIASLNISAFESMISSQNRLDSSSIASNQASSTSINLIDSIYSTVADKLINYIIKKHDRGITFDQVQELINKKILQLNQNVDDLIDWISKNQDKSQYIWFLGLFYYYNIGTIDDNNNNNIKAFELFLKAANNNYSIAQIYLAKCYYDGYGTENNKNLTFYWYQKSVNNGSIIGKFYLGYCYEFGIGVLNSEKESVHWYNEASKGGNTVAKLYLANCYKLGRGVDKDEIKAFKYYESLAKQEISDAQLELGNCFYNGIGTTIDKTQARYWYELAADKGNIIAGIIFNEYHKKVKFKLYKILFFKYLSELGMFYVGSMLLKANYEKSFYHLQKAARNGCEIAQFNLGKCHQLGIGVRKNIRIAFEWYKKSARQGYIGAIFQLIYCYNFGYGTEINRVKAFELVKIMSKKGDNDASYLLGLHYLLGVGINENIKEAFEIFKKLAENENQNAKYFIGEKEITIDKPNDWYSRVLFESKHMNAKILLGFCYKEGFGTEVDNERAFKLFKRVGKKGNAIAQYYLGNIYLAENNNIKAFDYYKKSADKGFSESQFHIAICYSKGIGTEINKTRAVEIIKELAEKGESFCAQNYLGELYEIGRDINKDLNQAVYWYCKATENGCIIAVYNLGRCYENGNGVEKDVRKAFLHYKKSADQGYLYAQFQLSECYYKGIGTEIDKTKASRAFELYKLAADNGNKNTQNNLESKVAKNGIQKTQSNLCDYELGNGVNKVKKSAESGLKEANFQLRYCCGNGMRSEIYKERELDACDF
ncbi:kinase-like domain-containing protein [Rhizophagus clarus]|uniref:Kinase-like domain-containing protein n=1 Tax=Rhizophagus clarus TaxID=94130 RepID=A0A8H3M6S0_9GLOM|nr:kinase-like domain-containing protein [Rhizophagus clarus]